MEFLVAILTSIIASFLFILITSGEGRDVIIDVLKLTINIGVSYAIFGMLILNLFYIDKDSYLYFEDFDIIYILFLSFIYSVLMFAITYISLFGFIMDEIKSFGLSIIVIIMNLLNILIHLYINYIGS